MLDRCRSVVRQIERLRRHGIDDYRFRQGLFSISQAARLVGMNAGTLETWAHGYERKPADRPVVKQGPIVTSVPAATDNRSIPFVGLVEATVVQAFRQTGLPLQQIRRALELLAHQGELEHALASSLLYSDGANVLYDYARRKGDKQLSLLTLTEVRTGQRVFHEVIQQYLTRITFGDQWATELIVPVTERPLLRVRPTVADGDPIFIHGGAPLSAVRSRAQAGEPVSSIARDYGVPSDDINEALRAVWPQAVAA